MNPTAIVRIASDRTLIVANPPVPCPGCQTTRVFLVNREGSTLCTACDERREVKP